MRREYPSSPIAGVAAVVFSEDRVLLTLRGNEPSRGRWGLPGGVVELGEKVEDAVVRETEEETGIRIKLKRLLTVFDSIVRDDEGGIRYHYVLSEYLCEAVGGTLRPSSDAIDVRWVPLEDLGLIEMNPVTRSFIEKVVERELISAKGA